MRLKSVTLAVLSSLSLVAALHAQTPPATKPVAPAAPAAETGEPSAQKQTVKVGAYIQNITKFDIPYGKYNVDLVLEFAGPEGATLPNQTFDILNGEIEKDNGKPKVTLLPGTPANVRKYKVSAEIAVDFDFRRYPFDEQDLGIQIYDPEHNTTELTYVSDGQNVDRDNRAKIPGFILSEETAGVVSEDTTDDTNDKYSIYEIPLDISRARFSAVLKTFAPLAVMLVISMLALGIGASGGPARLAAVTGTLLGAVMFHLSTTSSLPAIGYVTLTDKVFIASYLAFLVNASFTVRLMRKNDQKLDAETKSVFALAQTVVPVVTILMVALAFVL